MGFEKFERVTSTKNPRVAHIRELLGKRSAREESAQFVVEGVRLCEEALLAGLVPSEVFFSRDLSPRGLALLERAARSSCPVREVLSHVMNSLSETETSQGLLMVMPMRLLPIPEELNLILVLDQIRDPGNFGTLLRTAIASGVQAVFCTPGTVDPFSPKVLRSAMGAHFSLPIHSSPWQEIHALCKNRITPLQILLAESEGGSSLWQRDLVPPTAIVIGGEAEGASKEVRASVDGLIHIPMPGGNESLNASIAGSIILFEIIRQRKNEN
ncbi:MAG: RNA methyltransferase [Chloroflexi bacterium]|nr:RNA methyltransferase [Chloroflexota bacterium]